MNSIKELISLHDRQALITGASGKLGRVISEVLAELGASLILVDLPGSDIERFSSTIRESYGSSVQTYYCDLEDGQQRTEMMRQVKDSCGGLNILVNNAAFLGGSNLPGWVEPFERQSIDTWRRVMEVNLTSMFDLCQGFSSILRGSKGANIINIASIYGALGPNWGLYEGLAMANPAAYSVSKGGVIQLSRWLSTTLAPSIRVNSISPGGVYRDQPKKFVTRYVNKTPLNRMATESDLKGAIAYLGTDLSDYVTGQNLFVDGGWSAW